MDIIFGVTSTAVAALMTVFYYTYREADRKRRQMKEYTVSSVPSESDLTVDIERISALIEEKEGMPCPTKLLPVKGDRNFNLEEQDD